jgi:hypothetical protein
MDWFKLLKEPKLRTGSKITTTLGSDGKEDEEGPCFKKLKEYQEKIMSKTRILDKYIHMGVAFTLLDMPEEVACAALKSLNEMKFTETRRPDLELMVDGEEYIIESIWDYFGEYGKMQEITMVLLVSLKYRKNLLHFRIGINTTADLSSYDIEKYSKMVNWRDN